MHISAQVTSQPGQHSVTLHTEGAARSLSIAPKASGQGSSVNGGELLFLALATCYCNDVYREAVRRGLSIEGLEVQVQGYFGAEGEGATGVTYHVRVVSPAPEAELQELLRHTDRVAEIQNTLRAGTAVTLAGVEIVRD